jgi:protein transport protein SEC20
LDRGIRIAFWWTRFLPDSRGAEVLDMAERGAVSASVAQTLASISTGAAAAAATAVSVLTASVSSLAPEHTEAAFTSTMPVMDVDVDADMDVHTDDVTTADDEDGDSLDAFLPHGTVAGDVHDEL